METFLQSPWFKNSARIILTTLFSFFLASCEEQISGSREIPMIVGVPTNGVTFTFSSCIILASSGASYQRYIGTPIPEITGALHLQPISGSVGWYNYTYGVDGMRNAVNAQLAREQAAGLPPRASTDRYTIRCQATVPSAHWRQYWSNMTVDALMDFRPGDPNYTLQSYDLRLRLGFTYAGQPNDWAITQPSTLKRPIP